MQTVYVPIKDEIPEDYFTVREPLTKKLKCFATEQQAILLTKEDAEKIKAIDYNKALEMSKVVYPDNMGGMDEKGVNRYRAGYAKGYIDALTILNKQV